MSRPQDLVRSTHRELTHSQRGLEREQAALQRKEKELIAQIKKHAAAGQTSICKSLALQLHRIRQALEKLVLASARLTGVKAQTSTMGAQARMAGAMQTATAAMTRMSAAVPVADVRKTAEQYQREQLKSEMAEELISDALDEDETEAASAEIMDRVLAEVGLETAAKLPGVPRPVATAAAPAHADSEEAQLDRLLKSLGV